MAKLYAVLAVCLFVQVSYAGDVVETFNAAIRDRLNLYDKIQNKAASEKHIGDIKKLVTITERALKVESFFEKVQILSAAPNSFSPEFNSWISCEAVETKLNAKIQSSIELYKSLLKDHTAYETDIKNTMRYLENLLKATNLKQRRENYYALYETFSLDFQKFIAERELPRVNRELEAIDALLKNLLKYKDFRFTKEIQELKAKTETALANNASIVAKVKVLREVRFTNNKKLNGFLYIKSIEYS